MPNISDVFPPWVANLCAGPLGISGTIQALNNMGDNSTAKLLYQSYADQLTQWGTTIPNQPSTAALSPLSSMILGAPAIAVAGKGVATNP